MLKFSQDENLKISYRCAIKLGTYLFLSTPDQNIITLLLFSTLIFNNFILSLMATHDWWCCALCRGPDHVTDVQTQQMHMRGIKFYYYVRVLEKHKYFIVSLSIKIKIVYFYDG